MKSHPIRVLIRLILFLGIVVGSLMDSLLRVGFLNRKGSYVKRAAWLQRWSRRSLRAFNIKPHIQGSIPRTGLVLSNHLSYLDIIVLGAHLPMVFVAKSEIQNWPVIGWCIQCAGTLFVKRERKSDVIRVAEQIDTVLKSHVVVTIFPEGTSSDGNQVLPFHSSLLAPVENQNWSVTPAWIGYRLEDGSVQDEIAYWRDMVFGPHFLNLISKNEIHAYIEFGNPLPPHLDRKEMARQAHQQVESLRAKNQRHNLIPENML